MALVLSRFLLRWQAAVRGTGWTAASSFSTTATGPTPDRDSEKVYELRTYSIVPAKLHEYKKLRNDNRDLHTRHSAKLVGYWFTELGGNRNEAVHLWEYKSYAHRASSLTKAAADTEVVASVSALRPMITAQTSVMLQAFPWHPQKLEQAKEPYECYELTNYIVKPGLLQKVAAKMQYGFPLKLHSPIGLFYSTLGPLFSIYSLARDKNLEEYRTRIKKILENEQWQRTYPDILEATSGVEVKIMTPASFSPLR